LFRKILLAFDGSEASKRAGAVAVELASRFEGELLVVSVIEGLARVAQGTMNGVDEIVEERTKQFNLAQQAVVAMADQKGVRLSRKVVPGHAVETVLQIAEKEQADAIVVGSHGHSNLLRRIMGGTSSQIMYHARCTVIVVR
jgi:nucleotide-binding universal stress UspA family protein